MEENYTRKIIQPIEIVREYKRIKVKTWSGFFGLIHSVTPIVTTVECSSLAVDLAGAIAVCVCNAGSPIQSEEPVTLLIQYKLYF